MDLPVDEMPHQVLVYLFLHFFYYGCGILSDILIGVEIENKSENVK
jgi:hypothetical protein